MRQLTAAEQLVVRTNGNSINSKFRFRLTTEVSAAANFVPKTELHAVRRFVKLK